MSKNLVVVITLSGLLLLVGVGALLLMDDGKAQAQRPTIPTSGR